MKKYLYYILFLFFSINSFGQQIPQTLQLTKQDYLDKSKKQKTTGWVLLGTGTTAVIVGVLIDNAHKNSREQSFTGGIIEVAGIICGLTSIPFFVSSGKNKRKSDSLSLNFQRTPQIQNNIITNIRVPSITFKMSL